MDIPSPTTRSPLSPLSPRERRIMEYVAHGHSNKETGNRLGVTEQTVKNQVSTILRKVQARDRAQAAVMAVANGWVTLAPEDAPPVSLPVIRPDAPPESGRRGSRPPPAHPNKGLLPGKRSTPWHAVGQVQVSVHHA
ncbi:MAG: response regulator transcription factor [Dehalococcoidia bacterium]|nr:response regulator transcription factor [Dehalococcoidia bacterium]